MERRDLLRGGAIAAAMVIAGCSDEGDDDPADGDTNDTDEGDGGNDTDGADGNGDTAGGENATDEETDDAEGNGTDGEDGGDDQDDQDGEDDESADNETDGNETDDETDGDGEGDVEDVSFAETVETEDSYAFETQGGEGAEAVASTGRIDGGNMYVAIDEAGGTVEMYTVEGETYLVEGEECVVLPGMGDQEFDEEDVQDPEAEAEANPDLEATGRDTIDGEEVYVFEVDADEAAQYDEDVTYYVSVETGYVRRVETAGSVTDFHSWGDVEPVEAPEMECVDVGDFNESDVPL